MNLRVFLFIQDGGFGWLPCKVGCSKSRKIKIGREAALPLKGAHI